MSVHFIPVSNAVNTQKQNMFHVVWIRKKIGSGPGRWMISFHVLWIWRKIASSARWPMQPFVVAIGVGRCHYVPQMFSIFQGQPYAVAIFDSGYFHHFIIWQWKLFVYVSMPDSLFRLWGAVSHWTTVVTTAPGSQSSYGSATTSPQSTVWFLCLIY